MKIAIKVVGWLLVLALGYGVMTDPPGTANTVVGLGQTSATILTRVGDFAQAVSHKLGSILHSGG